MKKRARLTPQEFSDTFGVFLVKPLTFTGCSVYASSTPLYNIGVIWCNEQPHFRKGTFWTSGTETLCIDGLVNDDAMPCNDLIVPNKDYALLDAKDVAYILKLYLIMSDYGTVIGFRHKPIVRRGKLEARKNSEVCYNLGLFVDKSTIVREQLIVPKGKE